MATTLIITCNGDASGTAYPSGTNTSSSAILLGHTNINPSYSDLLTYFSINYKCSSTTRINSVHAYATEDNIQLYSISIRSQLTDPGTSYQETFPYPYNYLSQHNKHWSMTTTRTITTNDVFDMNSTPMITCNIITMTGGATSFYVTYSLQYYFSFYIDWPEQGDTITSFPIGRLIGPRNNNGTLSTPTSGTIINPGTFPNRSYNNTGSNLTIGTKNNTINITNLNELKTRIQCLGGWPN